MTEVKKEKEKQYTKKEVLELLKKQVQACSDSIDAPSITGFTARKKIQETKIIDF